MWSVLKSEHALWPLMSELSLMWSVLKSEHACLVATHVRAVSDVECVEV